MHCLLKMHCLLRSLLQICTMPKVACAWFDNRQYDVFIELGLIELVQFRAYSKDFFKLHSLKLARTIIAPSVKNF